MPSTFLLLLAAKLAVSACIVIGVTAAAERLGPRLGGLIAATPQLSVLALTFFTIEQGAGFAAEAAFWQIPGVCATIPVYLGYLAGTALVPAPRARSVAVGAALGTLGFVPSVAALGAVPFSRAGIMPFAAAVCVATGWLLRRLPDTASLRRIRVSPALLAVRAAVSALTVLVVTAAAQIVGPKWSGLLAGFPVNGLPVLVILHAHYGIDAIKPLIKIWPAGVFGICLFNVVASLTLERLGLGWAILLAYGVDIVYLAIVDTLRRSSARAEARRL